MKEDKIEKGLETAAESNEEDVQSKVAELEVKNDTASEDISSMDNAAQPDAAQTNGSNDDDKCRDHRHQHHQ